MSEVITITSSIGKGVRFNVRYLREGDRYGLENRLTWAEGKRDGVEFYDSRFPHTEHGQFVGRYFVETLLEGPPFQGLDLQTDIADWKIDPPAMYLVRQWLMIQHGRGRGRQGR